MKKSSLGGGEWSSLDFFNVEPCSSSSHYSIVNSITAPKCKHKQTLITTNTCAGYKSNEKEFTYACPESALELFPQAMGAFNIVNYFRGFDQEIRKGGREIFQLGFGGQKSMDDG